jgi:PEP-CTERM motif-containing protein
MSLKNLFTFFVTSLLLIFFISNSSYATLIQNGDFSISSELAGWTFGGDTSTSDEYAVLGDDDDWWSYLYQPIGLDNGTYTIEFDFKNELSTQPDDPNSSSEAFYDTFYASVYFINDIENFDLTLFEYDHSLPLFDMDANGGVFNEISGSISPNDDDSSWLHFYTTFTNEYEYAIVTFELIDWNFIDNDSQVFIDNVSITPVPEPATLILLVTGLTGLGIFSRKKR